MSEPMPRPPFDAHTARTVALWEEHGLLGTVTPDSIVGFREDPAVSRDWVLANSDLQHEDRVIPGPAGDMTIAVFRTSNVAERAPIILWLHGGGLIMGSRFDGCQRLEGVLQRHGGIMVAPEYRLAPEHPGPAGVEDCHAALTWVAEHADELGGDPSRIIVAGQSAGGGLAVGTALLARDRGGPEILGVLAGCPMLDDRNNTISAHQFGSGCPWNAQSNDTAWRAVLGERFGTDDVSPYEAPARATWLGGLPPMFMDVGSAEVFRDEIVALASGIWRDGGDAELHVFPGGAHGQETFSAKSWIGRGVIRARDEWVDHLLTPDDPEDTVAYLRSLGRYAIGEAE